MISALRTHVKFSSVVNVPFPTYYEAFLSVVKVFNLDLTRMISLGCYLETVGFYHRLLAITIVPLVLVLLLLVTFWFSRSRYWRDGQSMVEVINIIDAQIHIPTA